LPFTKTISELSIAISLPVHIAIAKSDCTKAAASFIPSHTKATFFQFDCNCFIVFILSSGITSEIILSTHICFQIYSAVCFTSPVSITTSIFIECNLLMTFSTQVFAISSNHIIPNISFFVPIKIGVFQFFDSFNNCSSICLFIISLENNLLFHKNISSSSIFQTIHFHFISLKSLTETTSCFQYLAILLDKG
jgi:hypothetical protein